VPHAGICAGGCSNLPADEYQAVYVTIDRVQAHKGEEGADDGEWIDVASNPGTYNLLELVNGVMQQLGITELETGHYSQMRLYIGNTHTKA
jgi:hypothetical protein